MATQPDDEACGNCRFVGIDRAISEDGERVEFDDKLVCRLNPPTLATEFIFEGSSGESVTVWDFPSVHADDWCGKYERRKPTAPSTPYYAKVTQVDPYQPQPQPNPFG